MFKIKKNNKLLIILLILGLILLGVIIILFLKNYKSLFGDIQLEYFKTQNNSEIDDTSKFTMDEIKGCEFPNDLVGVCNDYINCCSTVKKNDCFCNHPIVKQCNKDYNKCMKDNEILKIYTIEQLEKKCKEQVNACCMSYNDINIDSDKFEAPIKHSQTSNLICSLPVVQNIEQKCMELCQTYPECSAYSVDDLNCNLFSSFSKPKLDPLTGNPSIDTKYNYYIKKK